MTSDSKPQTVEPAPLNTPPVVHRLRVLTVNTHKGFTAFNRRFITLAATPGKVPAAGEGDGAFDVALVGQQVIVEQQGEFGAGEGFWGHGWGPWERLGGTLAFLSLVTSTWRKSIIDDLAIHSHVWHVADDQVAQPVGCGLEHALQA